jgi:hypothetical protein
MTFMFNHFSVLRTPSRALTCLLVSQLLCVTTISAQGLPRTGDGFFTDRPATEREREKEAREQEARTSRARVNAGPKAPAVKTITNFTQALRCMDELFLANGKRGIVITSAGIPDATGKARAGDKEMMISAISKMTLKSNAFDFIDLTAGQSGEGDLSMLFEHIASLAQGDWNQNGQLGLVVGATYPAEIARVRALAPTLPLLIPGVGAQGGDAAATVEAGWRAQDGRTTAPIIVNSSRSILYASAESDFAQAARQEALRLRAQLHQAQRSLDKKGAL